MVRLILTLWFALTALLGPGTCCCLFASHAPAAAPKVEAKPACPACAKKKTPDPVKAPKPACPCKKDSTQCPHAVTATQAPEINAHRLLADAFALVLSFDGPSCEVCKLAGPGPEVPAAPPFLDTDDLLYVCHILRC